MLDLSSRLPDAVTDRLATLRSRVGSAVFSRVAGEEGSGRRTRILGAEGPRWFAEDAPIRRVHGDASMFVGGLRALLLQSLHPLAMAGVAGHSGFRGDPWGRLQRTSYFLAATTFGPAEEAERVIRRIRHAHSFVHGTAPDGRAYSASDPHLLRWVHIAEIDSFLAAHDRYGHAPLDDAGRDGYVADTARVARALGVPDPPETAAGLAAQIAEYRPELRGTPEARDAARFLLLEPPLPLAARLPYGMLAAASVGLLPHWARVPLRLPWLPVTEATAVRAGGTLITAGIRWVTSAPAEPPPMPPAHP
ncbi:oxygenase MpaB family protein [Pseudonocardia nantongensis]|uniref:oxygenase MpaB family protein n=1 Tax=Pseudonocardia nantongensis TaxID=1181885 RepID=UPI00397A8F4C